MKNKIIFGLVFLFMVSLVTASTIESVFEKEIIEENRYTLRGTLTTEENEGSFRINQDAIIYYYSIDVETVPEIKFDFFLLDDDLNRFDCNDEIVNINLSSSNSTYYGMCEFYPTHTGNFRSVANIDGKNTYMETISVKDSLPSGLEVVLVIIGLVLVFLISYNVFFGGLGYISLITAYILVVDKYKYMLGDDLHLGLMLMSLILIILCLIHIIKVYNDDK